jgi:hypothetical protein
MTAGSLSARRDLSMTGNWSPESSGLFFAYQSRLCAGSIDVGSEVYSLMS